jgi:carbamoyl-phosphate synthase small subunit
MRTTLVIEDGTVVEGDGFGSDRSAFGELVFNTGMSGYQEALTDPSYRGQVLLMTYPLIGNYGLNSSDFESPRPQVRAYVVREGCDLPVHRNSKETLHDFLKRFDVPGIAGLDTRMLTIRIRERGTLKCAVVNEENPDLAKWVERVRAAPAPDADNLVAEVTAKAPHDHGGQGPTIALFDTGAKENIVRNLSKIGRVVRLPYNTKASEVESFKPAGVFVTNGPGDPAHPELMRTLVPTLRELMDKYPTVGICLGHQLLCLAQGGSTFKLKFGHRGANQPVKFLDTGRVFITSQNHGYAVEPSSLPDGVAVTQVNANDGTVEGMARSDGRVWSVQYHPEAAPGPWDSAFLFDKFRETLEGKGRAGGS